MVILREQHCCRRLQCGTSCEGRKNLCHVSTAGRIPLSGGPMQEKTLTVPELILIAGTRVALGAGVGLLLAEKLGREGRKSAGWALLSVGALTTIPLAMNILSKPSDTLRKVA